VHLDSNYQLHRPFTSLGLGSALEEANKGLFTKIAAHLRTRLGDEFSIKVIKTALRPVEIWRWSGISILDGDSMKTSLHWDRGMEGRRDVSFVRVSTPVLNLKSIS
jgi:hypothetical protein